MKTLAKIAALSIVFAVVGCSKSDPKAGEAKEEAKPCGNKADCEGLQQCWCVDLEESGGCHDDKDLPDGECLAREDFVRKYPACATTEDCESDRECLCRGSEEKETCTDERDKPAGGCMTEAAASALVGSEFFVAAPNPIDEMRGIKDAVCRCKDSKCVDAEMEKARNIKEPKDLKEEDLKEVFEIAMEMEMCAKEAAGGESPDDSLSP